MNNRKSRVVFVRHSIILLLISLAITACGRGTVDDPSADQKDVIEIQTFELAAPTDTGDQTPEVQEPVCYQLESATAYCVSNPGLGAGNGAKTAERILAVDQQKCVSYAEGMGPGSAVAGQHALLLQTFVGPACYNSVNSFTYALVCPGTLGTQLELHGDGRCCGKISEPWRETAMTYKQYIRIDVDEYEGHSKFMTVLDSIEYPDPPVGCNMYWSWEENQEWLEENFHSSD